MKNSKAIGRTTCYGFERRYATPTYETPRSTCPAAGTTLDTAMVNDHDDTGKAVAYGYFYELVPTPQDLSRQTDAY